MIHSILLGTCLAMGSVPADNSSAQAMAVAPVFSPERAFRIPLDLTDSQREQVTLCRLYYSTDQGKTWTKHKDVTAEAESITFRSEVDGEHWFSIALVDKEGTQWPANIADVEPGLRVFVDTQKPELLLRPIKSRAGHRGVRWELNDPNVKSDSFRLAIFDKGQERWLPLEPESGKSMAWFAPNQDVGTIQATVRDQAGNTTIQQVVIHEDKFQRMSPDVFVLDQPPQKTMPAAMASQNAPSGQNGYAFAPGSSDPQPTTNSNSPVYDSAVRPVQHLQPHAPASEHTVLSPRRPEMSNAPAGDFPNMERSFCNSSRVVVHYEIDEMSAPQRVELWGTRDGGAHWSMIGADHDSVSPVEADLSQPGLWGLRIVVLSPALPAQIPQPGDQPEMLVEVDITKPQVELVSAAVENGKLAIRWLANDANLENGAARLEYALSPQGPWGMIADRVASSGQFDWDYRTAGVQSPVYVRVAVADKAGNMGVAISPSPVTMGSRVQSVQAAPSTRSGGSGRVLGVQPSPTR